MLKSAFPLNYLFVFWISLSPAVSQDTAPWLIPLPTSTLLRTFDRILNQQVFAVFSRATLRGSHFYTTVNMVHTVESLLGLPAMNQNDAFAPVMAPLFSGPGDHAPFTAEWGNRDNGLIYQMNSPKRPGSKKSAKMNFSRPDAVDADALNKILWRDRKGNLPMPSPKHTVLPKRQTARQQLSYTPARLLATNDGCSVIGLRHTDFETWPSLSHVFVIHLRLPVALDGYYCGRLIRRDRWKAADTQ
jgi:hypothetical protein